MHWKLMLKFFTSGLMNRVTEEKPGWCSDPHLPPCAAYALSLSLSLPPFVCVWESTSLNTIQWNIFYLYQILVELVIIKHAIYYLALR